MIPRRALVVIAMTGAASAGLACGALLFGEAPSTEDAGAPADAASDGPADDGSTIVQVAPDGGALGDAASDGGRPCGPDGVLCQGHCVRASDCTLCAAAPLLCRSTGACVASCGSCAGSPVECFACDLAQKNPRGTCEPVDASAFCLSGDYSKAVAGGGEHCDCSNTNVVNCPGAQQVCLPAGQTDWCVTCGETGLQTDGKPCKGGGFCVGGASPPRCE